MSRAQILQEFKKAQKLGYALGSFSPRNTVLIDYVLQAAKAQRAPVMVQISSNELNWFSLSAKEFADRFFECAGNYDVPAILHLDHTYDPEVVFKAIEAGFQSVMIDASKLPFEENIRLTRQVVDYAHERDVAVEAELGNIGGADKLETGGDEELYTVPEQVVEFVSRSGCDTLAVSVGTAHGVYPVKDPKIDFERIKKIRTITDTPLVLHGGSGLPGATVRRAIQLDGIGGIAKINIATDLELVFQKEMGVERMSNAEVKKLNPEKLEQAGKAVRALCEDRICNYLFSAGKADAAF